MIWHGGKIAKANSFVSADTKLKGMIHALGGASSGRKSGKDAIPRGLYLTFCNQQWNTGEESYFL